MADVFVGPVIKKLVEIGFEYLNDQVRWQTGMKEDLEKLRNDLPHIQAIVDYASTLEQVEDNNSALNIWLWQLRDAIDEADDVTEELEYLKLEKQLTKTEKPRKVSSVMRSIKKRLDKIVKRALKIDPTLERLEKVVHKLDKVLAGFAVFLNLTKEEKQEHQELQLDLDNARETGSLLKIVPIGRDNEKTIVMNWLRETSNENQTASNENQAASNENQTTSNESQTTSNENQTTRYSNIYLLSIVGQGGMGKTTLLQQVYNEEMKNESDEKKFDLKMWVCVSKDFNKNKVIKDILESATGERSSSETLVALQQELQSTVNSKKFLLVLDDIWEEDNNKEMNKSKWEDVLAPLASGKLRSKILVTTRMESIAVMLSNIIGKKNEMLSLEGLKKDDCLLLLNRYAFANVDNLNVHPNLRHISEKMVTKLSGSPLAARVIGAVLNSSLDETHWNGVLNYEIGSQKGILDILKLSYIFLPKVLQSCFSLCCTFPQDYEFDKDDLVRMWIALGFIQPDKTRRETMKDAGERYFDVLIQKSLFDKFQAWNKTYRYKLHDLLHEMLRTFSTQECLSIVGGEEELLSRTPKTIRHLFVKDVNPVVLRKVEEFEHLRSFILIYSRRTREDLDNILAKIFKILRSIRLMHIKAPGLKQIPKEIGDLIHLKYLKMSYYYTEQAVSLPAFWRLPFLKYLFLDNMPKVEGFDYKFDGNEKVRVFPSLQVLHMKFLLALEDWFAAKAAAYECLFPCLTELHLKDCPNLMELPALPPKLEKLEINYIKWKGSNWLQGITNYCSISIQQCPSLISLKGHQEMDQTTGKFQLILSELIIDDPSLLLKVPLTSVTSIKRLGILGNVDVISFSKDDLEEWFLKVSSSLCELDFIFF